ncbi:hypothetical protein ACRAWF_44690 [Streptomyces sp. L7]
MSWTKDATGHAVISAYDVLGRVTDTWKSAVNADLTSATVLTAQKTDANKLTHSEYDTVTGGKGQPASATRYVGGATSTGSAYTQSVTAYDKQYHATGTRLTLPASDSLVTSGALASNTLDFSSYYNIDGTLQYTDEPAVGGLRRGEGRVRLQRPGTRHHPQRRRPGHRPGHHVHRPLPGLHPAPRRLGGHRGDEGRRRPRLRGRHRPVAAHRGPRPGPRLRRAESLLLLRHRRQRHQDLRHHHPRRHRRCRHPVPRLRRLPARHRRLDPRRRRRRSATPSATSPGRPGTVLDELQLHRRWTARDREGAPHRRHRHHAQLLLQGRRHPSHTPC